MRRIKFAARSVEELKRPSRHLAAARRRRQPAADPAGAITHSDVNESWAVFSLRIVRTGTLASRQIRSVTLPAADTQRRSFPALLVTTRATFPSSATQAISTAGCPSSTTLPEAAPVGGPDAQPFLDTNLEVGIQFETGRHAAGEVTLSAATGAVRVNGFDRRAAYLWPRGVRAPFFAGFLEGVVVALAGLRREGAAVRSVAGPANGATCCGPESQRLPVAGRRADAARQEVSACPPSRTRLPPVAGVSPCGTRGDRGGCLCRQLGRCVVVRSGCEPGARCAVEPCGQEARG